MAGDPVAPPSGTETILLVEDDAQVRELVSRFLSRSGYRVLAVGTGEEALELSAPLSCIDLLLTDVALPGLSGPALATRLSETRPRLKVLFMSGYVGRVKALGKSWIGADFLQKPFTPEDMLRQVRAVLDRRPGKI
jgi:two-component system cell cycle sensor histidine kinase/response regulator CckA